MTAQTGRSRPAVSPALCRPFLLTAAASAVVVTALGFRYSGESSAGAFERGLQAAVWSPWPEHGHPEFAHLLAHLGAPLTVAVVGVLLATTCALLGRYRLALVALAGPVLTGIATTGLKPVVGRTIVGDNLAFPSGHTAAVTALALVAALLAADLLRTGPAVGAVLVLGTAGVAGTAMALVQVSVGTHYPTDTIGGLCTALTVVLATAYTIDRLRPSPPKP